MQNDTTKNPTPAPGQVWRIRDGQEIVLGEEERDGFFAVNQGYMNARHYIDRGEWKCIGIETPVGRVMVGEQRRIESTFSVDRIADDGVVVSLVYDDGSKVEQRARFLPEHVAAWPLATEPAPADPYRQPYKPEKPIPPPAKGPQPKPVNVPERAGRTLSFVMAPGAKVDEVRAVMGRVMREMLAESNPYRMPFDWDRASVRDFKMPIPFAMASGPRMPMPEATATAQKVCGCWVCKTPFAIDPRAAREQRRREIDAVLREDARRFPAFATARRAAVMAACERAPDLYTSAVASMLGWIREYEDKRGAATRPRDAAVLHARATFGEDAQTAYERARAMP